MPVTIPVPQHSEIKRGTLRNIIADSDLSVEDYNFHFPDQID